MYLLDCAVLATSGIKPDEPLSGFGADHHHVVVGGNDDLVGSPSELQYFAIRAAAIRRSIVGVSDVGGRKA